MTCCFVAILTTGHFLEIYRGSILLLRLVFSVFWVFWVFWAFPCVSSWICYCFHDRRVEKIALPAGCERVWFLCLLFWQPGWCFARPPLVVIWGMSTSKCVWVLCGEEEKVKRGNRRGTLAQSIFSSQAPAAKVLILNRPCT